MCVSSAYDAMLKGTPRKMSALRWYIWQDRRPPATSNWKNAVARRQRHPGQVGDVPGRDDQPAGIGVLADPVDHLGDLVHHDRRPGSARARHCTP
jgi:hypothetical protein